MSSHENSHCCSHGRQITPRSAPGGDMSSILQLLDRFEYQMSRLRNGLVTNRYYEVPDMGHTASDPHRRSRLFDALFADDDPKSLQLAFHENPDTNQVECQLSTGCGNFFRPEDIQLNVKDRQVEFTAKREQRSEDGHNYSVREDRRVFSVPENADVEKLHAEMGPNGKIMITAPLLHPKPVEKKSDKPVPIKINRS